MNAPSGQRIGGGCRGEAQCALTERTASMGVQHAKGSGLPLTASDLCGANRLGMNATAL